MKGHLINCLNIDEVQTFEEERYVGLGPFYPTSRSTKREISTRLRILWDVIADLKRVQPGDVCFLHTKKQIFGPYVFKTGFRESQALPGILRSSNLSLENWWDNRSEFDNIRMQEYGYVASIDKPEGCNSRGADLMELFLRQSRGIFNSVPPRFMYGDTKKIVKPLLHHEVSQMLDIVDFNGDWASSSGPTYPAANLRSICLNLSDYSGCLFCEKILEAWFMENMATTSSQHAEIASLIGNFTYYANSIYTYYTNFLDVMAYNAPQDGLSRCDRCGGVIRNFANDIRVIELKRGRLADGLKTIDKVGGYMKWATTVLNPTAHVSGYIVAAGFNEEYLDFIEANNESDIHLLQYELENGTLHLERVQ